MATMNQLQRSASLIPPAPEGGSRRLNFVIGALGVGAIASILDSTIVNVALGRLSTVFGASLTHTQWVITGFLLAMAAIVPVSGWMIDRLGGRTTWMVALTTFLTGSVLCGSAWNLDSLIAFRILQGLGAGLILPVLMTLITQAAGQARLMTAMGSLALLIQVGPILGPIVGGALLQSANWRWIFLMNVPFCLAGLILAARAVPTRELSTTKRALDGIGLALLTPSLVAFIYALGNISLTDGLTHANVWLPLAIGAVLLAAFIGWSLREGALALIDVRLYADRSFAVANGLSIASGFTMFGGLLLLPLYFQLVHHSSVLQAGLFVAPQGLGAAALIICGKKITNKCSARTKIIAGFVLLALGTLPFALPGTRQATWLLIAALIVRGMGIGASAPSINATAVAGLTHDHIARGTTAFNIVQRVGAPFGTTVLAVILSRASAHAAPTSAGLAGAFTTVFWWTIIATIIPVGLAILLPAATRGPLPNAPAPAPFARHRPGWRNAESTVADCARYAGTQR
jgi:EmrB/QacA subfamily drug resistance transporter